MDSQLHNHKLFRLICTTAIVFFSIVLAFWACLQVFGSSPPHVTALLQITTVDLEASPDEIFAALNQLSKEQGHDISAVVSRDIGNEFALYTTKEQSTYEGIWPSQVMAAFPIEQLPSQDLRVAYLLEGDAEFHQLVSEKLAALGARGIFMYDQEWLYLLGGDLGKFLALGIGVVMCSTFFLALTHAKGSGIARLHGNGITRMVSRIFLPILVGSAVVLASSVGVIALWRGTDIGLQFGRYVMIFSLALFAVALFTLVISMGVLSLTLIMPLLKGRLRAAPILMFAAVLRIVMVAICLEWASLAIAYNAEYQAQKTDLQAWQQHPVSYKTYVSGAVDSDTLRKAISPAAQQIRTMSAAGNIYYHDFQLMQTGLDGSRSASDMSGVEVFNSVTYNRAAAELSLPPNVVALIEKHPADSIVVVTSAQGQPTLEEIHPYFPICTQQPTACVLEKVPHDYEAFSWQAGDDVYQPRTVVNSPVAIVVLNDLKGILDINISTALTKNGISFQSIEQLRQLTTSDEALNNYFYQVVPLFQKWKENYDNLIITRAMSFSGLASSVGLVCVFGLAYGGLLVISYAQRARNYRIFGLPPSRFYQKVAIWDLVVILGSVLLLLQKIVAYVRFSNSPAGIFNPDALADFAVSPWAVSVISTAIFVSAALSVHTISRNLS